MQSNPVNPIHRRNRSVVLSLLNPFAGSMTGVLLALGLWLVPAVLPVHAGVSGTVVAWGAGQTGAGPFPEFGQSLIPAGLSGVKSIAAGKYHTVALKNDGTVVAWGLNNHGQTTVPGSLTGVTAIASGSDHAVALKDDGTVVAWGNNDYGQRTIPAGLRGVTAIAAGYYETLALRSNGTVVAWGENSYGQTTVPAGLSGVIAIAAGNGHALALKSDGTVVAWGAFSQGQTNVPAGLSGVTAIAAGALHAVALKSDGTVVAWGWNNHGQGTAPVGLSGVTAIAAGFEHNVALRNDGTVVAWGWNDYGQASVPAGLSGVTTIAAGIYHTVAINATVGGTVVGWGLNYASWPAPAGLSGVTALAAGYQFTFASKQDGTVVGWGELFYSQTDVPAGLNGVTAIAAGWEHTVALKSDGTVAAWGGVNAHGETTIPPGLSGVAAIAADFSQTVALKSNGMVVAWGQNNFGQTTVPSGLSGVKAIAAGVYHTVALKNDGTVVAWGYNGFGQSSIPPGLSGVLAIAVGDNHNVALKSDGTVVAWGNNENGKATVPSGLSGVTAIAAGIGHTVALKSDGTVVAWGDNSAGQTTVPPGLSGVTVIVAGPYHTVAIGVVPIPQLPAFTGFGYSTVAPIRSSNPWQFNMVQSALVPDLRVRVQTTTTTNDEGSWEFLPGFATRLDSNWTLNTTDVPTGTRYFRAIATAPGYADRVTDPLAMIGPITVLEGIAPYGDFRYETSGPFRTGTEWRFIIVQLSVISGLSLRMQSSTNGLEGWSDLPGGGQMADLRLISAFLASGWMHVTTNLPVGTQYFRVVASALNYADRVSAVLGSFDIDTAWPTDVVEKPSGRYVIQSLPVQDRHEVYAIAVAQASAFYFIDRNMSLLLFAEAALTLAAEEAAAASFTIEADQTLPTRGFNIGRNTTVILKGVIKGDVRQHLIGNDVGTLIANDGGTLIGFDGGSLIANDGGSIVASGGGNIVGSGGGNKPAEGALPGRVQIASDSPAFTGVMTVIGNYAQEAGTGLFIAIAGTNNLSTGAQEYDQLLISGRAELGGTIRFALFDPNNVTNKVNLFQPPVGATFDVLVASNIFIHDLIVRGPVWGDGLHINWSVVNRADGKQAVRLEVVRIAPTLIFQAVGGKVEVAYPTNFTGYTLQRSPSLSPTNWTTFSTATNRIVIDATNSAGFFRLFKP